MIFFVAIPSIFHRSVFVTTATTTSPPLTSSVNCLHLYLRFLFMFTCKRLSYVALGFALLPCFHSQLDIGCSNNMFFRGLIITPRIFNKIQMYMRCVRWRGLLCICLQHLAVTYLKLYYFTLINSTFIFFRKTHFIGDFHFVSTCAYVCVLLSGFYWDGVLLHDTHTSTILCNVQFIHLHSEWIVCFYLTTLDVCVRFSTRVTKYK